MTFNKQCDHQGYVQYWGNDGYQCMKCCDCFETKEDAIKACNQKQEFNKLIDRLAGKGI